MMNSTISRLLAEALKLPLDERAVLADRIWDTIGPPGSDIGRMTEEEFEAELNRRHEEFLKDPGVGIPWEEAKRLILREEPDATYPAPTGPAGK
jgi:putative addiction module component (TIGR02574 family)